MIQRTFSCTPGVSYTDYLTDSLFIYGFTGRIRNMRAMGHAARSIIEAVGLDIDKIGH